MCLYFRKLKKQLIFSKLISDDYGNAHDSCSISSKCKGYPKSMKCSYNFCTCYPEFKMISHQGNWICNQTTEVAWAGSCSCKSSYEKLIRELNGLLIYKNF